MIPSVQLVSSDEGESYQFVETEKSHSVYFLRSKVGPRTYVGYSVDPFHRIRQHNGELVGGAGATSMGRPYMIICIISGFPTKRAALQFEKAWHILRSPPRKKKKGTKTTKKKKTTAVDRPRISGLQEALVYLFSKQWTQKSPPMFAFPLTLFWIFEPEKQLYHKKTKYTWECQLEPVCYPGWLVYTGYFSSGTTCFSTNPVFEIIEDGEDGEVSFEILEEEVSFEILEEELTLEIISSDEDGGEELTLEITG